MGNIYEISCSMTSFPLCELLALYILVHGLSCLWIRIGTATRLSGNSTDFTMTFSLGQSVWKVKPFLGLTFLLTHRHKTEGDDWQANHPDKSVSKIWGHIFGFSLETMCTVSISNQPLLFSKLCQQSFDIVGSEARIRSSWWCYHSHNQLIMFDTGKLTSSFIYNI